MFKGALKRGKEKKIAKKERNYGEIGRKMREGLRRGGRQDRRGVVRKGEKKVQPLATSQSGLGTGLSWRQTSSLGVPLTHLGAGWGPQHGRHEGRG